MKRITYLSALLACGFLAASSSVFAQSTPAAPAASQSSEKPANWFAGNANLLLLGRDDVASSKFEEYRVVPKGVSMPVFSLEGSNNGNAFALFGKNISQKDQRYTGSANTSWMGVSFDYNQIPHNIGNNGHSLWAETAPGVWGMSPTLRKAWGDTIDATLPTSLRTYDFYNGLLSPTFSDMNSVDIKGIRQRGELEADLSQKLPFDVKFTYMREVKTGNRGESGGTLYGVVNTVVDVPDAMNEVTTDYGVNFAHNFKSGNVHAAFNRNLYNDRQGSLVIDNPFRAADLTWVSSSVPGGTAQGRYGTPPDNEANRGSFGVLLKFAHQTRIAGDVAMGRWTQNDQLLPYTINSSVLTGSGAPANVTSSLPVQSLNGKINTTTLNFSFSSRPVEGLGVRLRYRKYDRVNKTAPIAWPGSVGWGDPERAWSTLATMTSNGTRPDMIASFSPYGNKSARFDGQVSYDIKGLTLEAAMRHAKLDRTYVEATSGKDNGYAFSAVVHANDMLGIRGVYDQLKRTASGYDATPGVYIGLPSNESERKTTRTGLDIELSPGANLDFTLAYFRRNDEYPNRPARAVGLDPATTSSGLISASYDTFTAEIDFNPSERVELNAYYTYEKNLATDRNITLTGGVSVNNSLKYDVTDKTNTFGANAVCQLVPEKWTFSLMARSQKVDGLMDVVAANQAGSFYTGRALNGFGGTQPITDYDDTLLTTVSAQLDYAVAKAWKVGAGYMYEKYTFADAFTSGTSNFPVSPLIMLKPNDGNYTANVAYVNLNYRF